MLADIKMDIALVASRALANTGLVPEKLDTFGKTARIYMILK